MIQLIKNPPVSEWPVLLQRPQGNDAALRESVTAIMQDVESNGDAALFRYTLQFDKVELQALKVSAEEMESALAATDPQLLPALDMAITNIRRFHLSQMESTGIIETMPGVQCWRRSVPIEKVGLYIPGGSAPLFSTLLMLAIPAQLAGCTQIVVCTPCGRNGNVHPAVLAAAAKLGITEIYKLGGVQAIAAMAYGTETVPQVYKIFGPGNAFVTCAKMLLSARGMAIDMPAGPSEVAVLADAGCPPAFIAADLLSQAEHGPDSQVILVSDSEALIEKVNAELLLQLELLPRKETALQALAHSRAIWVENLETGLELLNQYAPEHLIIATANASELASQVRNAGSVFLGYYSPESAGDYASGTNHTLPTNGFARAWSGVSLDSFYKKITFQQLSKPGLRALAPTIQTMARAEGLDAHALAIEVRLKQLDNEAI